MFKGEETKYFSLTEIINKAIADSLLADKAKSNQEISMQIINDMTYQNIWNSFINWLKEQCEQGAVLDLYPIGFIFNHSDKLSYGLSFKLSEKFFKDAGIAVDDDQVAFDRSKRPIKTDILMLSVELSLPKIYIQRGLNNLIEAIRDLLKENPNSVIDLGVLGSITAKEGVIRHHIFTSKKSYYLNKGITVKSLVNKTNDELTSQDYKKNSASNKDYISPIIAEQQVDTSGHSINRSALDKLKHCIQKQKENYDKIFYDSPPKKNTNQLNKNPGKVVLVPMPGQEYNLNTMLESTFQKTEIKRRSNSPTLFNNYSNTKAAPFTSEKTQIPISHRIGSFYTISLQNFIIDKTTKSVKRLYDEYFYRYLHLLFENPATEEEEYRSLFENTSDRSKVVLRKENYNRYSYYINSYIKDDCIANFKEKWLTNIVRLCLRPYNVSDSHKYDEMLNSSLSEIVRDYKLSIKKSILDYILKHPEQREKLNISISFRKLKEYAEDKVTRPSDNSNQWKSNFNLAKLRLSNGLVIYSDNIIKILTYYWKNLLTTSFLELDYNNFTGTQNLSNFEKNQKEAIENKKSEIVDDWKKHVEKVLKEKTKIYKDQLIIYFKSVAAVMSSQLRKLIMNCLLDYRDFILQFKKEIYHEPTEVFRQQFLPEFSFQQSFIEMTVTTSENQRLFCFSDELAEIHNKLINVIYEIVRSSHGIDRPDNMFIKNIDKRSYLWEIPIKDEEVTLIHNEIDFVLKRNLDNINKVLKLYEPFEFVLSEQEFLEEFKAKLPTREEIKKQITFYEEKLTILRNDMPNDLYMNMIKVSCKEINEFLREKLSNFIYDLLKYIQQKNIINKAKELNENIEQLKNNLASLAHDEDSLAKLENKLEFYKSEQIINLYEDYEEFLRWLFFYWDFDTYNTSDESTKDSLAGMETNIRSTHSSIKLIAPALETFEINLKEKRNIYELNLNKSRAELNNKIAALNVDFQPIKENPNHYVLNDDGSEFLGRLKEFKAELELLKENLTELKIKEELMSSVVTEDDRLDQFENELKPFYDYIRYYNEYKMKTFINENSEIRNIQFDSLTDLIKDGENLFEVTLQRIPTLKNKINKFQGDWEQMKSAIELGKLIHTVISGIKLDLVTTEQVPALYEDNAYHCLEILQFIYSNELKDSRRAQEIMQGLKLKELVHQKMTDKYKNNKDNVDKYVTEWEAITKLHLLINDITNEVEIDFETENFKDKKYVVISHSNFHKIKYILNKNISALKEKIENINENRDLIKTVKRGFESMEKLEQLLQIIISLEENQKLLENHMQRANELHEKLIDSFYKLKEVEKQYKVLIDQILENPKVIKIFSAKSFFKDTLHEISKSLSEIPLNYGNNS